MTEQVFTRIFVLVSGKFTRMDDRPEWTIGMNTLPSVELNPPLSSNEVVHVGG
jgi:hypothetical protein